MLTQNQKAFLELIGTSEGTSTIKGSDRGYNVLVGGTLFTSYADHPRKLVDLGHGLLSTAAGKFQILARYFDVYKKQLDLPDFSPASQDAVALTMIGECKALDDIEDGDIQAAINKCGSRWASFPSSPYGQPVQKAKTLIDAYVAAGGSLLS